MAPVSMFSGCNDYKGNRGDDGNKANKASSSSDTAGSGNIREIVILMCHCHVCVWDVLELPHKQKWQYLILAEDSNQIKSNTAELYSHHSTEKITVCIKHVYFLLVEHEN